MSQAPAILDFFVPGVPGTKGSVRAFAFKGRNGKARAAIKNDSKKAEPWTAVVSLAARAEMRGGAPIPSPVIVDVTFFLPRPKSHRRTNGELKAGAPAVVATKPDGDKLLRCTWDALTGIVFVDDSQIVEFSGRKAYAQDAGTGARITVKIA